MTSAEHPKVTKAERYLRRWVSLRKDRNPDWTWVPDAISFMKQHTTGRRDNGEPNQMHPLYIACALTRVIDYCEGKGAAPLTDGPALMVATLCHDLMEDAGIAKKELAARYSADAAETVRLISNRYHDDHGNLISKSKGEIIEDMRQSPLGLIGKCLDRSHNFDTMVDIEPTGNVLQIIYTPEKVVEKLIEASDHMIPAGDPLMIGLHYEPRYHPYILAAREILTDSFARVLGRMAYQDAKRTPRIVDNPEQRTRMIQTIRPPGLQQIGLHRDSISLNDWENEDAVSAVPCSVAWGNGAIYCGLPQAPADQFGALLDSSANRMFQTQGSGGVFCGPLVLEKEPSYVGIRDIVAGLRRVFGELERVKNGNRAEMAVAGTVWGRGAPKPGKF